MLWRLFTALIYILLSATFSSYSILKIVDVAVLLFFGIQFLFKQARQFLFVKRFGKYLVHFRSFNLEETLWKAANFNRKI